MKTRLLLLCAALSPLMACGDSKGAQAEVAHQVVTPAAVVAAPAAGIKPDDPRMALAARIPGAKPEDLRATPVPGVYELSHGTDLSYVTADAKYVFSGDLYQVNDKGE